jgi:peptidyl-dipeptidase Dcp
MSPSSHAVAQAEVARLTALADADPILAPWPGPYGGVPPWERVTAAGFPAAFATAIALREAELAVITAEPAPPSFANTILALEDAGRHLARAQALFAVLSGNQNDAAVQAVEEAWAPRLAEASDRQLRFNRPLFTRIAAVWAARDGLAAVDRRLVELLHDAMVRGGARLEASEQAALGAINVELAGLYTSFGNRVLADEETAIVVDDAAALAGIPADVVAACRAAAIARGRPDAWAIVNTRSCVDVVLATADDRGLREQVWRAFKQRGANGDGNDTRASIARIVRLRAERAQLLGFASHAALRLADTMAKTPAAARALMQQVWPAAVARVRDEVAAMAALAGAPIAPWDYLYYAERVRAERYQLDGDELAAYFTLEQMIAAAMWMAERLYGLTFREITGAVPTFHPDVRVWEVVDGERVVGLFYGDYFARPGKRSGAWMSSYRYYERWGGHHHLPIVSNNNNFVPGPAGAPVVISLDDAHTLFHEFGHALHYLLAEVPYPSLADTPNDFVEFPSQLHEAWVLARPVLDRFARHVVTGAPMPQALVDKVVAAGKHNQGYATVEYLSAALIDLALHERPDGAIDPATFEDDERAALGAPPEVALRHRLPHFAHLFTGDGYSAGYYAYLWAEVMDADARGAFTEAGDPFAPEVAAALRRHLLAPGNASDRAEAYRAFRGRDPDPAALLVKRGLT